MTPTLSLSSKVQLLKKSLSVAKIVALETDQLVLASVQNLWDFFNVFEEKQTTCSSSSNYNNSNYNSNYASGNSKFEVAEEQWLVAAAENYQPWASSRVKTFRRRSDIHSNNSDADNNSHQTRTTVLWSDYHGE
jgi:hypothetical protein